MRFSAHTPGDLSRHISRRLWENLADPILSRRDKLGFNKIWYEILEPIVHDGGIGSHQQLG